MEIIVICAELSKIGHPFWKMKRFKKWQRKLTIKVRLSQFLIPRRYAYLEIQSTVQLNDKERFDKEQIGVKEPFPVTKC